MEPLFGTNPYQQYKSLQADVNGKFSARQNVDNFSQP